EQQVEFLVRFHFVDPSAAVAADDVIAALELAVGFELLAVLGLLHHRLDDFGREARGLQMPDYEELHQDPPRSEFKTARQPPLMAATKWTSLSGATVSNRPIGLTTPSTATEMPGRRRSPSTRCPRMPGQARSRFATISRTVAPSTRTGDFPPVI